MAGLAAAPAARAQSPTLVFLVRHAEKAAQPASDPPLTAEGTARANALADVLAHAGVNAIITTQYLRTRSTAAPLAARLGLTIETVPIAPGSASNPQAQGDALRAHVQATVDAIRRHAGGAVLVVAHSNTIGAIATALGAPKVPELCDGDYDQLFVLEMPPTGAVRFARVRFGAPATDPACRPMRGGAPRP